MSESGWSSPQGTRRHVLRILRRHGFVVQVAEAVFAAGTQLLLSARQEGDEFAAVLDRQTGEVVGSVVRGAASDVDVGTLLQLLLPGHRYVAIHTHRMDTSFSDSDSAVLLANASIETIVVAGVGGTWYVLSKVPGRRVPDPQDALRVYTEIAMSLSTYYLLQIQRGTVVRDEALRAFSHHIWQVGAARLGLRYDRVPVLA